MFVFLGVSAAILAAIFLLFVYIPMLVGYGAEETHDMLKDFGANVFHFLVAKPLGGAKWITKKAVPNSFPTEKLSERGENVVLRLCKIADFKDYAISRIYPKCSPNDTDLSKAERRKIFEQNREQGAKREMLNELTACLNVIINYVKSGDTNAVQRNQFSLILGDLETLLRYTPACKVEKYNNGYSKDNKRADWDLDMAFSDDSLRVFLERASEVHATAENLRQELIKAKSAKSEAADAQALAALQEVKLTSTNNGYQGVAPLSLTALPAPQRTAFEKAREQANTLPLIESERVKRILADSAEAQALAKEASANGEISFDGRTPEQMVSAILADNAERLNRTIEEAKVNSGAADRLRVLEKFTEERVH